MTPPELLRQLTSAMPHPPGADALALAGTIAMSPTRSGPYRAPIRGLDAQEMDSVVRAYFPDARALLPLLCERIAAVETEPEADDDEFHDLIGLLLENATVGDQRSRWLAHAVATAAMGPNHLWQDLGLPSRRELNALMQQHFTALRLKNAADMKWKKFLYRQLCERAEVLICKSPTCGACSDFALCFGPEH